MADRAPLGELSGSHILRVRYCETDQMGVVYHANYLVWFHEARDALLAKLGLDLAGLERGGYRFPVVDVGCRYLRSARFGDEVLVFAHLARERVARMRFRFEVRHARTKHLLATGHSVSVVTDHAGKLLVRLPNDIQKTVFADHCETSQSPAEMEELQQ